MLKRPHLLAAILIIGLSGTAQSQQADASTVIVTIDGTEITLGHMIIVRDSLPDQYRNLPDDVLFDGIKEQLIQQTVLAQSFEGLEVAIRLRLENEERSLKAGTAINAAVEISVTEEALAELYQTRFAMSALDTEYNVSHILVETEAEARALIDQLSEGAEFDRLAQDHSTGPSGPNGGQLGWFGSGMMVKEFEDAVVALGVGDISAPVETQFGWHVIILNENRVVDAPPIDDVRADLEEELRQMAVDELVTILIDMAEVVEADTSSIDPAVLNDTSLVGQ